MNKFFVCLVFILPLVLYKFDSFGLTKKSRLNTYYANELRLACLSELNPETQKAGAKELDTIENNMLQDGYDRAQIKDLRNKAYCKASKQRTEVEKLMKTLKHKEVESS